MIPRYFSQSVFVFVALTAACGVTPAATPVPSTGATGAGTDQLSGRVTVFAAASLTDSFNELARAFQVEHPRVSVTPSYAASSTLAAQIVQGAEADVFASADEPNMRKVVDAALQGSEPKIFARNRLEIVVQAGNPKRIVGLADLARPDVIVVLAAPAVPVGAYANQALGSAGVHVAPKSLETDVKQVIGKLSLGEADAGIAYRTDVSAGGVRIQGVRIADQFNVTAAYPIAILRGSKNESAARAFVDFVFSTPGRETLTRFGFLAP